ncbi:M14 family metallopeptidase [Caulobacter sp. KR2-114]|uniref:M14 family metallopeptidase n=1 Tax=Caulobacter sp. KR2-114 TaxID=3400912 RepID=UPI003C0DCF68
MAFNAAECFAADYQAARAMFQGAVAEADGSLDSVTHPERGPDGGELATDIAWFGPRDAEKVLVTLSGTHGVEGFCGSGAQVHWLRRAEHRRLPAGVAVMLVHAVNPYGFAWLRRVTEDNVDLNRNWIDFAGPLPANPAYDRLHDIFCPAEWGAEVQAHTAAELLRFAAEHGPAALQAAMSGGQFSHPDGVFFGGAGPTWSRRTQTEIYRAHLSKAAKVGIIDFHTGLGPWGFGEQIVVARPETADFARARSWYGSAITSPSAGTSTSADITGDGLSAAPQILSNAQVTGMALEVGTRPIADVTLALRADAWLHAHGDPTSPQAAPIKRQIRDAFYGDADDWKGMVAGQSMLVCRQAVAALAAG